MPAGVSYTHEPVEKQLFYWLFLINPCGEARLYRLSQTPRFQNGHFMRIHAIGRRFQIEDFRLSWLKAVEMAPVIRNLKSAI
jgi:hypothetical protein